MTIQQQYEKLKKRIDNAAEWLDAPERTEQEIEKWLPRFNGLLAELIELEKKGGKA